MSQWLHSHWFPESVMDELWLLEAKPFCQGFTETVCAVCSVFIPATDSLDLLDSSRDHREADQDRTQLKTHPVLQATLHGPRPGAQRVMHAVIQIQDPDRVYDVTSAHVAVKTHGCHASCVQRQGWTQTVQNIPTTTPKSQAHALNCPATTNAQGVWYS